MDGKPPHHYAGIHKLSSPKTISRVVGQWGNIYTDTTAKDNLIEIIKQFETAGIKVVVLYSGHYAHSQKRMIKEIAYEFNRGSGIKVISFCEGFLLQGDHAGISETSFML